MAWPCTCLPSSSDIDKALRVTDPDEQLLPRMRALPIGIYVVNHEGKIILWCTGQITLRPRLVTDFPPGWSKKVVPVGSGRFTELLDRRGVFTRGLNRSSPPCGNPVQAQFEGVHREGQSPLGVLRIMAESQSAVSNPEGESDQ